MTGLFRRLARQVVGPQPTRVHAMARLPFVPPPEPPVAADTGTDTADPAAPAPTPTPGPTTQHVETTVQAARTTQASPASAQASPPAIATRPATAPDTTAPESMSTETHSRRPATQTSETILNVETVVVAPSDGSRPPAPPAIETPAAIDTAPNAMPDAVCAAPLMANDLGLTIPPPLVNTSAGAPQAHIAEAAAATPPTARDNRAGQHGNTPPPASEPTEVHVHIGRIEVTAVSEPAPARSRPRAGKAPMSLEEYLAQRQRGRP